MSEIKMSRLYDELLAEVNQRNVGALDVAPSGAPNVELLRARAILAAHGRQAGRSGLIGEILYVRNGFIHGWAIDTDNLHRQVPVKASVDGHVVATATANEPVPSALVKALPRDVGANIGFVLRAFSNTDRKARGFIDVVAGDAEFNLATNLTIFPPGAKVKGTPYEGFCDPSNDGVAKGWAWNTDEPERRLNIVVFIDGFAVARGQAGHFRGDLAHAHVGTGDHAFSIQVPKHLLTERTRAIEFVLAENGLRLPGSPMLIRDRHIFPAPKTRLQRTGARLTSFATKGMAKLTVGKTAS